ncbi:hypothetical protein VFPPC_16788 [Pochonia chlamydosporia 170]|uniref:DUF6594 domain-containing protein n=1 Tax=Pochonia chlamydosporia 170 TaxID=1380566 RepID=A0A179F4B1_METCM|nr:hypothetical protein VFPPC_16788 [Pochonia chlamydosporia 170]OAQ60267.1 hypothetical protein VFPPC_16788 [Pochonia chlamydosporia 170]
MWLGNENASDQFFSFQAQAQAQALRLGEPSWGNISIHYITGFGEIASFIASDADHTTAVYKRFDKLAARDLLYYECELLELEAPQDQYDREDAIDARRLDNADLQRLIRTNARDWLSFKQRAMKEEESNDKDNQRWKKRMKLAMDIRATLKAYREALLLNSTLLTLHQPPKQTLTTLSNYFHQQHVVSGSQASQQTTYTSSKLSGAASSALYPLPNTPASQQATDLVTLSPQTHIDSLTYFLKTYCSWLFEVR